ncbi:MAG: alpha-amylase/4-alpha-glucanotransferase domain-containing protein [Promethearchaeota archaeon]|jgi:alpha-amylase
MNEKEIYLPIVFHFHQPVDNFNSVFEDVYKKAYRPLIENIFKYPKIKFTLHFSGNLLEWLLDKKPDFIKIIKILAKRGQIEIIGGGYYEPIFAIIPNRDKIAQINMLSDLITKEFGLEVRGAWLSERVWEPNYPSFLSKVGLKYVIVDDNHFRSTGIPETNTFYSYITEDEGKTLRLFPINEGLRYLTPWRPTHFSIDYLKKYTTSEGDRIALLISDAEKMGVWGTTHQICYIDGQGHEEGDEGKPFIPAFFDQILKNKWIKTITLSEYMDKYPAKGLIYLPTASYDKMEEWVLPTKERKQFEKIKEDLRWIPERHMVYLFLKGGFWRHFLVKYPESNNMHKKMLFVREKLIHIEKLVAEIEIVENRSEVKSMVAEAWKEIYKSQCNDCYWHGLFGGVYLQFLRFSVYSHLINAEKIIDTLNARFHSNKNKFISITPIDFTKDSRTEFIIETDLLNVYVNPSDGGTIFELDYKPKSYNILNTLTRWPEAYHDNEDIDIEEVMVDRYKRNMLRIRFFNTETPHNLIETDQYQEHGSFIDSEFKVVRNEKNQTSVVIELVNNGNVKLLASNENYPCSIRKIIKVEDSQIAIKIKGEFEELPGKETLLNKILKSLSVGVDFPFFFNGEPSKFQWKTDQTSFNDNQKNQLVKSLTFTANNFKAYDESYELKLNFSFESQSELSSASIKIFKFPIITYAFTDEGYKKIYQGINLLPQFKLSKEFEISVIVNIS